MFLIKFIKFLIQKFIALFHKKADQVVEQAQAEVAKVQDQAQVAVKVVEQEVKDKI